jgi:hypothetical protein
MAINIDTQDLDNYPGNVKRVVVDQDQIVPTGYEGDEKIVYKVSTTAYSDIGNTTAIQDVYIIDFKGGWCRSSGFAGSGGKFDLDATHNTMKVKIDATVSGSDGSGYYEIVLDYNIDSTPVDGDSVAADVETKLRALTMEIADAGFALAYLNCSVTYQNGKFWITSGSVSRYYSGSTRSSVVVATGSTNDCLTELGFDLATNSEGLDAISANEALLGANYTTDTTPLTIGAGTGVVAGDCLSITDGTNIDYFTALSGTTDTSIVVPTDANNSYIGVTNSYSTSTGAIIQKLRIQDAEGEPTMWYTDVDAVIRFGIKTIVNQIDYSS